MTLKNIYCFYNNKLSPYIYKYMFYATLLCCIYFLFVNIYELIQIKVWRHDCLIYIENYDIWCRGDGRWIIKILFPLLKNFNPYICIFISYIFIFLFSYNCISSISTKRTAIIGSLVFIQIPSIYSAIGWPIISFPAYFFLFISSYFYKRYNFYFIFVFFGILFGGTFQHFYNLLPLLFLKEIFDNRINICKFIGTYIFGFVLGYIVSELAIFVIYKNFIEIAGWRQPHPIKTFSDVLSNFISAIKMAKINFSHTENVRVLAALLFFSSILMIIINSNKKSQILKVLAVIYMVMASIYVQIIPSGIDIGNRTLLPTYASILFIIILSYKNLPNLCLFIMLALGVNWYNVDAQYLKYHKVVTNTYLQELQKINVNHNLKIIAFTPTIEDLRMVEKNICEINGLHNRISENFTDPYRWVPVAWAAGYHAVSIDSYAQKLLEKYPNIIFTAGELYSWAIVDKYLFIKFNQNFFAARF